MNPLGRRTRTVAHGGRADGLPQILAPTTLGLRLFAAEVPSVYGPIRALVEDLEKEVNAEG